MLLIAAMLCLVLIISSCSPVTSGSESTSEAPSQPGGDLLAMRANEEEEESRAKSAPTRTERVNPALEAIEEYERILTADPDNPENAGTMIALANLHLQQFQDYRRAAQWYREYLNQNNNPDNPQTGVIYAQLLRCYEALEDNTLIIPLCQEMLRVFPPDRQEYIYADKYLRGLDMSERIPLPAPPPDEGGPPISSTP